MESCEANSKERHRLEAASHSSYTRGTHLYMTLHLAVLTWQLSLKVASGA